MSSDKSARFPHGSVMSKHVSIYERPKVHPCTEEQQERYAQQLLSLGGTRPSASRARDDDHLQVPAKLSGTRSISDSTGKARHAQEWVANTELDSHTGDESASSFAPFEPGDDKSNLSEDVPPRRKKKVRRDKYNGQKTCQLCSVGNNLSETSHGPESGKLYKCRSQQTSEGRCTIWSIPKQMQGLLKPSSSGPSKLGAETKGGKLVRDDMRTKGWQESKDPKRWVKVADFTASGSGASVPRSGTQG